MKLTGAVAEKGPQACGGKPPCDGVPRVWIVVAGARHAHVFCRAGGSLQRIAEAQAGAEAQDMSFMRQFSRWLAEAEGVGAFDRLVVVASQPTLGGIRASLSPEVHRRVAAEVDWEVDGMPEPQVRDNLAKIVWF